MDKSLNETVLELYNEVDSKVVFLDKDIEDFSRNKSENEELFENKFHYIAAGSVYVTLSMFSESNSPLFYSTLLFFGVALLISLASYIYAAGESHSKIEGLIYIKKIYLEFRKSIIGNEHGLSYANFDLKNLADKELSALDTDNNTQIGIIKFHNHIVITSFAFGMFSLFMLSFFT